MVISAKIPVTLEERLEYGEKLIIPAGWEEFLDALEESEYRIEYDAGEIISFMGYATENHEKLVGILVRLLGNLLKEDKFDIFGSNLALHIPGFGHRYYNADCAVVEGESEKVILRGNMTAVANPILLVEVLSPSTEDFDLGRKFRHYREIPSLQQVLFIDSTKTSVVSQTRHNGGNDWLLREFTDSNDEFPVLKEGAISVKELYRKVKFTQA
ncbi:MAG: Uma2 family endonuclease [Saprospiraceae bacterium]